ncbi:hypothetical protein ABPG75_007401 [Micractinium tetrahymenae]
MPSPPANPAPVVPAPPSPSPPTPKVAAASCSDGKLNGQEVDVDCGGICPGCGPGKKCNSNSDCQSGLNCFGSPGTCTANGGPGASYQCGSLPGSSGSSCLQGSSCVQTGPTTYQCLPTDSKCPPQGCPVGTYCSSGRCICNGVTDPSTVTSKTSSCPSDSTCVPIASGSTTTGQLQYVYQCCADAIGGCSAGSSCTSDAQCASGYACVSGKCTSRCEGGAGCASDQVCENRGYGSYLCYCPPGTCYDGSKCVAADAQHCSFSGFTYPGYVCGSGCTGGQQCVQTNPLTGTWACQ